MQATLAKQYVTRQIKSSHEPWTPHHYQERGVDFALSHAVTVLWWDPGLGKSSVVLEAFRRLKEQGQAKKMLVIAPLRVCQLVWTQEGRKWSQFRSFTFSLLHGPNKEANLKAEADIYLINPEGIAWLSQQLFNQPMPFDVVTIDETTKFKNSRAGRSKKLRKKIHNRLSDVRRVWGLTGTPSPNGYMDLFGQFLVMDDGQALGRYITFYRDQYFQQSFNGFTWQLRDGAAERIEEKIAPYVLRMSAEDYLELPPLIDNIISIELEPSVRRQYEEMKKEMLLALPEGVVTASNAGAAYSKLAQLANGAVYLSTESKDYAEVHGSKLDALEDLIEELSGQPLLVAYQFQSDLVRIRERLGEATPTLSGLSHKRIEEVEAQWNRGELPVLLVHPASAGHGLNLQGAGASHICWFSRPWDLELYDQTIRRIFRQGSTAERIVNHVLVVKDTMDETIGEALEGKDTTQQRLLAALNAEIMRDKPAPTHSEDTMAVKKLGFREDQGGTATAEAPKIPKGWGTPATAPKESIYEETTGAAAQEEKKTPRGWGSPTPAVPDQQRAEIQSKIRAPQVEEDTDEDEEVPASVRALQAFGQGVVKQLNGEEDESPLPEAAPAPVEKAKDAVEAVRQRRQRRTKAQIEAEEAAKPADSPTHEAMRQASVSTERHDLMQAKAVAHGVSTGEEVTLHSLPLGLPKGRITLEFEGIPGDALASFFEMLGKHIRNGNGK